MSDKLWDEKPPIMVKPSEQVSYYLANPKFLDWLEKVEVELDKLEAVKKWEDTWGHHVNNRARLELVQILGESPT